MQYAPKAKKTYYKLNFYTMIKFRCVGFGKIEIHDEKGDYTLLVHPEIQRLLMSMSDFDEQEKWHIIQIPLFDTILESDLM